MAASIWGPQTPGVDVITTASAITFTPAGTIAATNVQDAIEELDAEAVARVETFLGLVPSGVAITGTPNSTTVLFGDRTWKMLSFLQTGVGAVLRTLESKLRDSVNVKDYGAVGDGVVDDTAAINLALQATVAFASVVSRVVYIPPGQYKITGSLYLRAGCGFVGDGGTATRIIATGMSSSDIMLRMGYGNIAGIPTSDGSGLCPFVSDVFFNGQGIAISTLDQAGFRINRCWFSCTVGVDAAGADGIISECIIDTLTPVGIGIRGSRIIVIACNFNNPNYGIVFSTPLFAAISQIIISDCLFFAAAYASSYAYADAIIADIVFNTCKFTTSIGAGVRQADQRHFFTQAGVIFELIRFVGCEFDNVKQNDIEITGGVGTIEVTSSHFRRTGIVDGGASFALQHSIVINSGALLLAQNNNFSSVGGQSIRLANGTSVARINSCHNFSCGSGGSGLAASVNEGDKAHFHFLNGSTDIVVSNCSTDSTALYVAGTYNLSYFHGRANKSNAVYDTHSSTAGGTYYSERHNGTVMQTVASAAALTLPFGMPNFFISGTTTITSIVVAGWTGQTILLVFLGALTLTDGSNLKLAGNFVTTADDCIKLFCDGTDFYELSRSVN